MTIKAILRNGLIHPLEPLPADWSEGQELVIEQPSSTPTPAEIEQWLADMEVGDSRIPPEDHERFQHALDEIERQSKDAVRREWGLP